MKPLALLTAALLSGITPNLHAAELEASDGAGSDRFGNSVSLSGSIGLVGADWADIGANTSQGSAYVFRNLDTATGTVTENVKLTASDGAVYDQFGISVSQSGSIGLVGASFDDIGAKSDQGSAYVFRNLDTATGSVTQNVKLTASDGAPRDQFGISVSQSGSIGLVSAHQDDIGANANQGSAYVFRNLDTATGTVTQNVKLTASDGAAGDFFGYSVSLDGSIGLVGAEYDDIGAKSDQGSAYVFRNLNTATGTVTQNVKLIASDGAASDRFGRLVSLSGSIGLVGADQDDIGANSDQGSAYVFRNLDTATGTVTQNVKLTASDGAANDLFGISVSLDGSIGLVGAYTDDIRANFDQGSAYVFRNLDTATGTVTQNVKLTASDGAAGDRFGISVSLDGDNFVIGAQLGDGLVANSGKAYTGSVSSVTTLDAGNTSRTISGISFESQDDWIIGQTTDSNQVTLSAGDTANVTAPGKAVYIGKDAGSDNNTLLINGSLIANQIYVGATGNSGNELVIGETGMVNGNIIFAGGTTVGGDGTITGDLTLGADSKFIFSLTNTLTVTGSVSLDSTFGIDDVIGLDSSVALGTYTLINGTATDFASLSIENWGAGNAYDLGSGKSAYFKQGSLQVEVVPEPGILTLLLLGLSPLALRRRRNFRS